MRTTCWRYKSDEPDDINALRSVTLVLVYFFAAGAVAILGTRISTLHSPLP